MLKKGKANLLYKPIPALILKLLQYITRVSYSLYNAQPLKYEPLTSQVCLVIVPP